MSDCLADLILRPHAERTAVRVALTLVAGVDTLTGQGPGADEPAEVDGDLVPAAVARELAYTLGLLPRPTQATPDSPSTDSHDTDAGITNTDDDPFGNDTARNDTARNDTARNDTARNDTAEDGAVPNDAVPNDAVPNDAVPNDAVSNHPAENDTGEKDAVSNHPAENDAAGNGATTPQSASAGAVPPTGEGDSAAGLAALRAAELAPAQELRAAYADARRRADAGAATAQAALTRLLDTRRLIDTALEQRPRIAVTDQLSGALLALTDSTELRAVAATGRGLGPPPGTDAYRPTDPLHRFVVLRDRRCRFPGCRVRCCDLDHQVPHPHGPTAHDNLACLCEHHHRLSHQAPGWRLHRDADGGLVWTLPGGRTLTTHPPAFGTDDGSTPTVVPSPPTGRQTYAAALAAIGASRPGPPDPLIPF